MSIKRNHIFTLKSGGPPLFLEIGGPVALLIERWVNNGGDAFRTAADFTNAISQSGLMLSGLESGDFWNLKSVLLRTCVKCMFVLPNDHAQLLSLIAPKLPRFSSSANNAVLHSWKSNYTNLLASFRPVNDSEQLFSPSLLFGLIQAYNNQVVSTVKSCINGNGLLAIKMIRTGASIDVSISTNSEHTSTSDQILAPVDRMLSLFNQFLLTSKNGDTVELTRCPCDLDLDSQCDDDQGALLVRRSLNPAAGLNNRSFVTSFTDVKQKPFAFHAVRALFSGQVGGAQGFTEITNFFNTCSNLYGEYWGWNLLEAFYLQALSVYGIGFKLRLVTAIAQKEYIVAFALLSRGFPSKDLFLIFSERRFFGSLYSQITRIEGFEFSPALISQILEATSESGKLKKRMLSDILQEISSLQAIPTAMAAKALINLKA